MREREKLQKHTVAPTLHNPAPAPPGREEAAEQQGDVQARAEAVGQRLAPTRAGSGLVGTPETIGDRRQHPRAEASRGGREPPCGDEQQPRVEVVAVEDSSAQRRGGEL